MTESGFELLTFGVSACSLKQLSNLAPLNLVREMRQAASGSLPGAEADARTTMTSLTSLEKAWWPGGSGRRRKALWHVGMLISHVSLLGLAGSSAWAPLPPPGVLRDPGELAGKEASTWSRVEKDRYSQGDSCRWSPTVAFSFSRQLQTVLCTSADVQDAWVRAGSTGQGSG